MLLSLASRGPRNVWIKNVSCLPHHDSWCCNVSRPLRFHYCCISIQTTFEFPVRPCVLGDFSAPVWRLRATVGIWSPEPRVPDWMPAKYTLSGSHLSKQARQNTRQNTLTPQLLAWHRGHGTLTEPRSWNTDRVHTLATSVCVLARRIPPRLRLRAACSQASPRRVQADRAVLSVFWRAPIPPSLRLR